MRLLEQFMVLLSELGPLPLGLKAVAHFGAYLQAGTIAQWVIEWWHPFTRGLWGQIFPYLDLADFGEVQKDALTLVIVFSIPFAIAVRDMSRQSGAKVSPGTRMVATLLAIPFASIMCLSVIRVMLAHTSVDEDRLFNAADIATRFAFPALPVFILCLSGLLVAAGSVSRNQISAMQLEMKTGMCLARSLAFTMTILLWIRDDIQRALDNKRRELKVIALANIAVYVPLGLAFLEAPYGALPAISMTFVCATVALSAHYSPAKLMRVSGAALGLLGLAHVLDLLDFAKVLVESSAT